MVAAKPDCTNERFGRLTVLGKSGVVKTKDGRSRGLWTLECDCGKIIDRPRAAFDRKNGQKSCGCSKYKNVGLKPKNIAGQRFGSLVAVRLTGKKDANGKPTWLLNCDCGGTAEMSATRLGHGFNLRCDSSVHKNEKWLHYPPTPIPYPTEAGELAQKYLYLCRTNLKKQSAEIEDTKRDRLLRACWILTYRRQQGEEFSELHEKHFISKHLAFCSVDVFWEKKLEQYGGEIVTIFGKTKRIGGQMTDRTLQNYPVAEAETLGNSILSKPPKRIKFRRC